MADQTLTIEFNPNPTQKNFILSQARADYFSSRVREGKSAGLAWSCFYHTQHNPGALWVFVRDTWENLQRTTLKEFFYWFPPGIMGTWHSGKKEFTWAEGTGCRGSVLWFGMDDPNDAGRLQSLPLAGLAMDEVAPAEGSGGIPEMVFDIGLTRLNQPGMNWYACKLASNNPDESHWSYRRFAVPGTPGFKLWQPQRPENEHNLPAGLYAKLRQDLQHRPDLIRRFVDGQFGYQQVGKAVTPQWNDDLHLATGLVPTRHTDLTLCWDFGLNPTCLITQVSPLGYWYFLWSFVGDGIGVEELIVDVVRPVLQRDFRNFRWNHVGDPMGITREASSSKRSAVLVLRKELGGIWRPGPVPLSERIEPLRAVLSRTIQGVGVVQVDRTNAKHVYHALRGGWHFKETNIGVIIPDPVKDMSSHPGDAAGYGAARLFPLGRAQNPRRRQTSATTATFFGAGPRRPIVPKEARTILPY